MFKNLIFIFALMGMFSAQALAAPLSKTSDLGIALKQMSSTQGFSTNFEQVLQYAEGGKRVYQGELSVLRPGKFRWHYTKPYEQLYVSNGEGVWLYEPDLLQAQLLKNLGDVDPVVVQLLDGRVGLSDVDVIQHEDFENDFSSWHIQVGQQEHAVEVWLGVKNKQLLWIESRDVVSNRNRLNLLNLNFTSPDATVFEFVAPEGVDVIGVLE